MNLKNKVKSDRGREAKLTSDRYINAHNHTNTHVYITHKKEERKETFTCQRTQSIK